MSGAAAGAAAAAAAAERLRQLRLEEETMTAYAPKDLDGWQFKIVRGTFRTIEHMNALKAEQAVHGWTLVEVFDTERVRFKRPATETLKDPERFGNPYATTSTVGGMTSETKGGLIALGILAVVFAVFFILMLTLFKIR